MTRPTHTLCAGRQYNWKKRNKKGNKTTKEETEKEL
jgi:hypothetical protein